MYGLVIAPHTVDTGPEEVVVLDVLVDFDVVVPVELVGGTPVVVILVVVGPAVVRVVVVLLVVVVVAVVAVDGRH